MTACLHFVGFDPRDPMKIARASRVFGAPDFVHRLWDVRAACDIAPGDTVVFAKGTEADKPSFYPYSEDEFYARQMRRLTA